MAIEKDREQKRLNECPHVEITKNEVLCHATDWGKGLTGKQIYGSLPHAMIVLCSSPKHVTCPMFQKSRGVKVLE